MFGATWRDLVFPGVECEVKVEDFSFLFVTEIVFSLLVLHK